MASIKKILLITEGPEDKKVLSRLFRAYDKEVDIVTFKFNKFSLHTKILSQLMIFVSKFIIELRIFVCLTLPEIG